MGACEGSSDGEMALFRGVVGLSPNVLRIPTPWKGLNRILSGGFYGGELVVVSGCGLDNTLSAFVRNLVLSAAKTGTHTFYMNSVGSNTALLNQFILDSVPVEKDALWDTDKLTPAIRSRIEEVRGKAKELPLICCRTPLPVDRLEIEAGDSRIMGKTFFVIDPVTLVCSGREPFADALFRLKRLATTYAVPVLVSLESLKREVNKGTLEDFPEAVLAHADKMITLKDDTVAGKMLHVAVIRNRDGELGSVVMSYDPARFALVEGERVVPEYINEPVPIHREQRRGESEEERSQRRASQVVGLLSPLEEKGVSTAVRDNIRFIRKKIQCGGSYVATFEEMGFSGKSAEYCYQKGSRYVRQFVYALERLEDAEMEPFPDVKLRKTVEALEVALAKIPDTQRGMVLEVVKGFHD